MADPLPHAGPARPVRLWRLVAGAFLHFGIVAYVVGVPLACLLAAPASASVADFVRLGLRFSGWALVGIVAAGVLATAAAALVDTASERRRTKPTPDVAASERRLAEARASASSLPDAGIRSLAAAIASRAWHHDDPRGQVLSRDFAGVVRTAAAALASASLSRLPAIRQQIETSLRHIERALDDLAAERARTDEDRARATALYVERRYGPSDFATKPD